jgi:hypothetical protein
MMAGAIVAMAACSGKGEIIPTPTPGPDSPATTAGINEAAREADPTTTTAAPEPEPEPTLPPTTPPTRPPRPVPPIPPLPTTQPESAWPDNGAWAIPEYIVMCESGGRWDAYNSSGASGPYQLMPMHFGGELAMNQSRAAQHAKAAELWNGGKGKSHWSACL